MSFMNTSRVSNCLDPDQAQHLVQPDLGSNCLQSLSAVDIIGVKSENLAMQITIRNGN